MKRTLTIGLFSIAFAVQASVLPLEGRDINGNAVAPDDPTAVFEYDPNLDITWLRDWNVIGPEFWSIKVAWAANLKVGSFDGWMLPTIDTSDTNCDRYFDPVGFPRQYFGFNCTGSPMAYLWYTELGNTPAGGLTNTGPFQHMQSSYYWSGTEYVADAGAAWWFNVGYPVDFGIQGLDVITLAHPAVAVRPGDVAVPEPATLALFGIGLAGLAVSRRRKAN